MTATVTADSFARVLERIPARDRKRYSYARAIAKVSQSRAGPAGLDGIERELSDELRRHVPPTTLDRGGFLAPLDLRSPDEALAGADGARTLQANAPGRGPELTGGSPVELVELLRARLVSVQLGATFLTIPGPVPFATQTAGASAQWLGEVPAAPGVAQTDPTFGLRLLAPKSLMASNQFSRQLLVTSRFDVEQMVRSEIAAVHAAEIDRTCLHGSGAGGQPAGLYATPGVAAVAFGGPPTLGNILALVEGIEAANAGTADVGFATTPAMARRLSATLKFASGSHVLWDGPLAGGVVAGYRAIATTAARADLGAGTEHALVAGNFAEAIIGSVGAMELVVDPYTNARQGLINVTSFEMVDVLFRRPEAFARATGATVA